jgi:hypothetical protein
VTRINTDGVWVNVGKDPSYKSHFRGLGTSQIHWGSAAERDTSSYEFVGNSVTAHVGGDPFVLGTFIHHNFPIYLPFEHFEVDLKVTVTFEDRTTRDVTIPLKHHETPNQGPVAAWADVVDLPAVKVDRAVRIDGVECDMLISGFYWHGQDTPTRRFRSDENGSNEADLHVQFTATPS